MERTKFPNETDAYRDARNELLTAEIELRQKVEEVAALRRRLPLGGEVPEDYTFEEIGADGEVRETRLSELFAQGQSSLFVYGYMFGPAMERACPMCTSLLDGLEGNAHHITQRISLAVVARSPVERIRAFAEDRGWSRLRLLSSAKNSFHRDYLAEDEAGNQWPMANVFVRRNGRIHHFWGSELMHVDFEGGNQRHVDMLWPLWNVLDLTPEGRGEAWFPSLDYSEG